MRDSFLIKSAALNGFISGAFKFKYGFLEGVSLLLEFLFVLGSPFLDVFKSFLEFARLDVHFVFGRYGQVVCSLSY